MSVDNTTSGAQMEPAPKSTDDTYSADEVRSMLRSVAVLVATEYNTRMQTVFAAGIEREREEADWWDDYADRTSDDADAARAEATARGKRELVTAFENMQSQSEQASRDAVEAVFDGDALAVMDDE